MVGRPALKMSTPSTSTGRSFGRIVRSARVRRGLTLEDLVVLVASWKVRVSVRNLQRIEHDETDPRISLVCTLAVALELTSEDLRIEDLVGTPWRPPA